MTLSPIDGQPPKPSSALVAPSCMWPPRVSVFSSQWSAIGGPAAALYWSARRRSPGDMTGWPSSEKPAAPASASSTISVSSAPAWPFVIAAEEPDRHLGLAPRPLDERAEHGGRVDDRIGVRHGEDGAVAARGGGARARDEILLVLPAGRAQVDVRVDERRREHEALALDHAVAVRVEAGAELGDRAAVDADVEHLRRGPASGSSTRAPRTTRSSLGRLGCDEHHATSWISATLTPTGPCVSRS